MRSPITKITMLLFCIILSVTAKAQIVTTNPLEYVALAEGNELILGKVKDQMDGQKKTALCRIPLPQSSSRCASGRRNTTVTLKR